jgi:phosphohistidine phosphatase SixA
MEHARASLIELYLLRHAHAGDPLKWHGRDDLRPLSGKGERQVERLAGLLKRNGFAPDAIISSPRLRALQTAQPIAAALGLDVRVERRLAVPLGLEQLEAILVDSGDPGRALLVGHDPDFSELVALLCSADSVPLRKGALARIDGVRPISPGGGTLRWLIPPELLETGS